MRILHVSASYLPATRYGGTIVSVHGLCRALAERGHDVQVYTTSVDGPVDSVVPHGSAVDLDGVKVWYFRSPRFRRLYWAPAMRPVLRAHVAEFDVVHTHSMYLWPLWTAARCAHAAGVPYIVSPRGVLEKALIEQKSTVWKAGLIGFIEKRTLEQAAAVHMTSTREAEQAAAFGFQLPPVRVIPNGVAIEPPSGPQVSEGISDIAGGGPFLLFLGRVNWKKGLDRLIRALRHVPDARLVVAGNDEEEYAVVLDDLARQSGVGDRVIFTGPVHGKDKAALLSSARVLVLPSYSENFGNVVIEAMAAGCPVIVTPEVGVAESVAQIGAGLVIDGAPTALGRAIAELVADHRRREEMGTRGRVAAATQFSWPAVAAQMEQLYQSVATRRTVHA